MSTQFRAAGVRAVFLAVVCAAAGAGALAGSASADPDTIAFTLFNCTGPAGTPSTIPIEKQAGGLALHVVGETSTFKIVAEDDLTSGASVVLAQGFDNDGHELVTCEAFRPDGHHVILAGLLTPAN